MMSPELEGLLDPADPFGERPDAPPPTIPGFVHARVAIQGLGTITGRLLDAGVHSFQPYMKIQVDQDMVGPLAAEARYIDGVAVNGHAIANTSWAGWRPRITWEGDSYALVIEYEQGAE